MRFALFPIISLAHRRLSCVRGTRSNAGGAFSRPCVPPPTQCFPGYPVNEEVSRPLEKRLYLFGLLALEKLRAGGNQRIDKPCAVLACPAPGLFNAALNEVVVSTLRLDDMEVVLAPAGVNVGIAGILFFLSFVMGFQRSCRIALVLFKSQIACCAILLLSPFLSYPGVFHRKIPQKYL